MAMNERATVVVGVDGSAGSRTALRFALEDAARRPRCGASADPDAAVRLS
jgi:hypothetical protein